MKGTTFKYYTIGLNNIVLIRAEVILNIFSITWYNYTSLTYCKQLVNQSQADIQISKNQALQILSITCS